MFECGWSVTPSTVLTVAVSVSRLLRLLGDFEGVAFFPEAMDGDFVVFLREYGESAFGVLGESSLHSSSSDFGSNIDGKMGV